MLKLIFLVGCLLLAAVPTRAAFLQECEGVIINRVPNPNPECSEYVHCNGDDSYYCNGDCTEPVSCYGSTAATVESTTASTSSTVDSETSSATSATTIRQTAAATTTISTTSTSTTSSDNLYVICRNSGRNGVYPYPANSNYYYQCLAGYLLLQQCPQNFEFVESRGQCIGPKF